MTESPSITSTLRTFSVLVSGTELRIEQKCFRQDPNWRYYICLAGDHVAGCYYDVDKDAAKLALVAQPTIKKRPHYWLIPLAVVGGEQQFLVCDTRQHARNIRAALPEIFIGQPFKAEADHGN